MLKIQPRGGDEGVLWIDEQEIIDLLGEVGDLMAAEGFALTARVLEEAISAFFFETRRASVDAVWLAILKRLLNYNESALVAHASPAENSRPAPILSSSQKTAATIASTVRPNQLSTAQQPNGGISGARSALRIFEEISLLQSEGRDIPKRGVPLDERRDGAAEAAAPALLAKLRREIELQHTRREGNLAQDAHTA